ncbi:hypothetical protein [Haliangium sp.]|uniref:hypothetical protein n=1 Tax=Haliangium sp. TaxID=2663208 RepID=UPI003D0D9F99
MSITQVGHVRPRRSHLSRGGTALVLASALTLGWGAALSALALSAPLSARPIPADAEVVVHIDLEAVRGSRVYRHLDKRGSLGEAKTSLDADLAPLTADLFADAAGLSFWARGDGDDEAGALIVAGADTARMVRTISAGPGYETRKAGGHTVHGWGEGDDRTYLAVKGRWAVLSEDADDVRATLDVLDGRRPSMSPARLRLPKRAGMMALAVFGDRALDALQKHAESTLLNKGKLSALRLIVGEQGDSLYAQADIDTASAEEAKQVRKVMDGALALGMLSAESPELQTLMRGISVSMKQASIEVKLELATSQVLKWLDESK